MRSASEPVSTYRAHSNIALIKYWGKRDASLNLPLNSSLSLTLSDAHTTTTVRLDPTLAADEVVFGGRPATAAVAAKVTAHLDRIRRPTGRTERARVQTVNSFPTGAGIASSASAFAALTAAGADAFGLDLNAAERSILARQGSGSACRSMFGGIVRWDAGIRADGLDSVAEPVFPVEYWDLCDVVVLTETSEKTVGSTVGHRALDGHPFLPARLALLPDKLDRMMDAIARRDLPALGPLIEQEALEMHGLMMSGSPGLIYWAPATVQLLRTVPRLRAESGLTVYFTLDAGPTVHLICERADVPEVERFVAELLPGVATLTSGPGPAPVRLSVP